MIQKRNEIEETALLPSLIYHQKRISIAQKYSPDVDLEKFMHD